MASEVFSAREGSVNPINATGNTRSNAGSRNSSRQISFRNGLGGTRQMNLSEDAEKNEVMRLISKKFTIDRGQDDVNVDDYARKTEDGYEVKVWGTTGQSWQSDKPYGQIIFLKNNPDYILRMKKVGKRWQGTLTQRGYYGRGDTNTKLIF